MVNLCESGNSVNKSLFSSSQIINSISTTKTTWIMFFRKVVTAYCDNLVKCTNALCKQNAVVLMFYVGGTGVHSGTIG